MSADLQRRNDITLPLLALFWLPLALMWVLMGIEQPALNGVMARLPEATRSLAAFEVAFGIALVIESPILQMLSAATALVRGARTYRQMLRFMHALAFGLTVIHFTISRPVVFGIVAGRILGVPADVIEPARHAFTILMPFAALVGYRRLWQGSLIQMGKTGVVAHTMVIRLVVTLLGLAVGIILVRGGARGVVGSMVGAWSLSGGVAAGAAASWWYHRRAWHTVHREDGATRNDELTAGNDVATTSDAATAGSDGGTTSDAATATNDALTTSDAPVADQPRSLSALLRFYVPLSLTSIMALVSRPILAFGISRSVQPLESLATWPVINSLLFLFTSIALSYQEAVVAKARDNVANTAILRRFGLILTAVLTAVFLVLSVTGGSRLWFRDVAGLRPELVALAQPAMVLLIVMPLAVTGRSFFSGLLVARERTGFLSVAVLANTITLLTFVVVLPRTTDLVGTIVAAVAFGAANVVQLSVLWVGNAVSSRGRPA